MVDRIEGKKVIGLKQSIKHIKSGKGQCLYVAKDADGRLVSQIIELAEEKLIKIVYIDSMKELGILCGIDVGATAALILQ